MNKSDQFISRHYDNDGWQRWYFTRDTKLPHGTFPRTLRERAVEWAAMAVIGLAIAGTIVLCNIYL